MCFQSSSGVTTTSQSFIALESALSLYIQHSFLQNEKGQQRGLTKTLQQARMGNRAGSSEGSAQAAGYHRIPEKFKLGLLVLNLLLFL